MICVFHVYSGLSVRIVGINTVWYCINFKTTEFEYQQIIFKIFFSEKYCISCECFHRRWFIWNRILFVKKKKESIIIPLAWSMPKGYIVFICSVHLSIRPSYCPDVIPSVNPFYNQVLLQSFLITYNSEATDQNLFIFGMGVPRRVLFHSTSMNPWVMPQGGARGQNLGHPNKVVYCSLFLQTTSY